MLDTSIKGVGNFIKNEVILEINGLQKKSWENVAEGHFNLGMDCMVINSDYPIVITVTIKLESQASMHLSPDVWKAFMDFVHLQTYRISPRKVQYFMDVIIQQTPAESLIFTGFIYYFFCVFQVRKSTLFRPANELGASPINAANHAGYQPIPLRLTDSKADIQHLGPNKTTLM